MWKWLLLASLGTVGGCYAYLPADNIKLTPGNDVALELNAAGSDSLAPVLGRGTRNLRGHVVSSDSVGVKVVLSASGPQAAERFWDGSERLSIPWADITSLQVRRFSAGRSAVVGGAIVGVAIGAAAAFSGQGQGGVVPGGTPGQPQ